MGDDISDIPSMKKLREQAETFEAIATLGPVLRLFGFFGRRLAEPLNKVDELSAQTARLTGLPDRFNDAFAERGWIAYEHLKVELMEEALALAEDGRIDEAEERLADYYDEENIRWQLQFMRAIAAFEPRLPLAERALEDYLADRYHSCIPVVLMLLDGLVDDVGKVNRGFFAKDVDLTAWDSISAHSKGLRQLAAVFGKKRMKTTAEPVTVPYRHGILHGHDLGYANKLVAAKCWAALFSLRDWAIARRDQRAPKPEKAASIFEILRARGETQRLKDAVALWRPRSEEHLRGIPRTGTAEDYDSGSPERMVVEFLEAWRAGNYGRMARSLSGCNDDQIPRRAGQLRREVEGRSLQSFEVVAVRDDAAAISVVDVELHVREPDGTANVSIAKSVRVLFEDDSGRPTVRGAENGEWRLVNIDVLW